MHDPLDLLSARGVRIVWVDDFDLRVVLVRRVGVVLIDPRASRQDAAEMTLALLDAVPPPHPPRGRETA